jgi:hypothetical protein
VEGWHVITLRLLAAFMTPVRPTERLIIRYSGALVS